MRTRRAISGSQLKENENTCKPDTPGTKAGAERSGLSCRLPETAVRRCGIAGPPEFKNRIRHPADDHRIHFLGGPLRIPAQIFIEKSRLPGPVYIKKRRLLAEERPIEDQCRLIALLSNRAESPALTGFRWRHDHVKQVVRLCRRIEMRLPHQSVILDYRWHRSRKPQDTVKVRYRVGILLRKGGDCNHGDGYRKRYSQHAHESFIKSLHQQPCTGCRESNKAQIVGQKITSQK